MVRGVSKSVILIPTPSDQPPRTSNKIWKPARLYVVDVCYDLWSFFHKKPNECLPHLTAHEYHICGWSPFAHVKHDLIRAWIGCSTEKSVSLRKWQFLVTLKRDLRVIRDNCEDYTQSHIDKPIWVTLVACAYIWDEPIKFQIVSHASFFDYPLSFS
jgi:hypothetical protein